MKDLNELGWRDELERHNAATQEINAHSRQQSSLATRLLWGVALAALLLIACVLTACANPLAQGRVAVLASKEMLRIECPQYLASLYPERLERCATRLVAQQAAEAAYNGAVLADAVGSGEFSDYYARFKGLIAGLLK